jgi:Protein of unknown function (DUF3987)/Bifunctional DNA primase/polymerase, N-terminal/Primase C terminal 2 (PriCT-2)
MSEFPNIPQNSGTAVLGVNPVIVNIDVNGSDYVPGWGPGETASDIPIQEQGVNPEPNGHGDEDPSEAKASEAPISASEESKPEPEKTNEHATHALERTLAEMAVLYAENGFRVFTVHTAKGDRCSCGEYPCGENNKHAGKHPWTKNGFNDASKDSDTVRRMWREKPYANIGLASGKESNLVVLDEDGLEAQEFIKAQEVEHGALPVTKKVSTGRPDGVHKWFRYPKGFNRVKSRNGVLPGVDFKGDGGYVIAPPSLHKSGRTYAFINEDVSLAECPKWLADLVNGSDHAGGNGQDRNVFESVADQNKRTEEPWTPEAEAELRSALVAIPSDDYDTWLKYGAAIFRLGWGNGWAIFDWWSSKSSHYGARKNRQTWESFYKPYIGNPTTLGSIYADAKARGWVWPPPGEDTDDKNSALETGAEWTSEPDWSMLDDRRGELPEFPLDAIGSEWRACVTRAARGAATTGAHVVVPLLGIASALIGTARRIKASPSWSQPATFWVAVVGYSGTGKSPGLQVSQAALDFIMKQLKLVRAELQREHATKVEVQKAAEKKWKAEVSEAMEAGNKPPEMPKAAMPVGEFVSPRHYVSDTTIERLAVLLTAIPRGTLLLADELSGLFLNMSRYSSGQDNEFWLQSWNGSSYVVERMGRPPIELEHLLIGMAGGLQPDKLAKSFEGAADGMYARVCFSWPSEPPHRPLSKEAVEVDEEIVVALRRLIDLPSQSEEGYFVYRSIPLSDEALKEFEQFRQFVHEGKKALDGRDREWLAKGPAHVLRLALTLAFLVWARKGGEEPTQIDARYMKGAIQIVRDYFAPHSRAALRQIGLSERHVNARQALRWIRLQGKTEVSVKDIRRDALSGRLDEGKTIDLLDAMERGGWVRKVTTGAGPKGGRKVHRWHVNPLLPETPAETAATAETPPADPDATPPGEVPAVSAVSARGSVSNGGGVAAGLTDPDADDFLNF